jgi:hypothetical protein
MEPEMSDAELEQRLDAHKNLDALLKTVRTLILMKYLKRTPEEAQRVSEFSFAYDHSTDIIPEMRYWLRSNRNGKCFRSIKLGDDKSFQEIPPVKELKKIFKFMKDGDDQI